MYKSGAEIRSGWMIYSNIRLSIGVSDIGLHFAAIDEAIMSGEGLGNSLKLTKYIYSFSSPSSNKV